MENNITIIIAEDSSKWRSMIRSAVENHNITIIGEAENGQILLDMLKTRTPDIILLDLNMPVLDGNKALDIILKRYPSIKVIITSLFGEDPTLALHYKSRGVNGSISKTEAATNPKELPAAIKTIQKGGSHFNYNFDEPVLEFTVRQKDIINRIGDGQSRATIARELNITTNAVDKQKEKIMDMLNVKTSNQLFKKILERGYQFFMRSK